MRGVACAGPFVRTRASARASPRIRLALSKERTSSAPALITAHRRSYFTPRSSIIHAVNNALLFRVTLYPGLLPTLLSLPSFLPSPAIHPAECPATQGREVGVRAVSVWDILLSPDLSTETDTLRSTRSREASSVISSLFDFLNEGSFP